MAISLPTGRNFRWRNSRGVPTENGSFMEHFEGGRHSPCHPSHNFIGKMLGGLLGWYDATLVINFIYTLYIVGIYWVYPHPQGTTISTTNRTNKHPLCLPEDIQHLHQSRHHPGALKNQPSRNVSEKTMDFLRVVMRNGFLKSLMSCSNVL